MGSRSEGRLCDPPSGGTHVETDMVFTATTTHEWKHAPGEIVTVLMAEGLQITGLVEHDSVPWEASPGQTKAQRISQT